MATQQRHQPSRTPARARSREKGAVGNERLTAATGAVLLALLAVIGLTILRIHGLLSVHMFVGLLLIPPVLVKLASTGYRFMRYYTNDPVYKRKGPPPPSLRLLAPLVVLSTLVVFVSGVVLLFAGPSSRDTLLPIHKDAFFVWLAATAVHVLGHLAELPPALRADFAPPAGFTSDTTGRRGRVLALSSALVAGLVLAIVLIPEYGSWLNGASVFLHH